MSFWRRIGINAWDSTQIISSQDGNGRIQRAWNATFGTNKRFMSSGEPAFFEDLNIIHDPYYTVKYAVPGTEGQAITWDPHFSVSQDGTFTVYNNLTARNYLGELSGSVINSEYSDATVNITAWYGSSSWSGSGSFIVINNTYGYIVTNAHVVCATDLRTPKVDYLWINVKNANGTGENLMIKVTTDMFVDGIADIAIVRVPGITSAQKHLNFADYSTVQTGDLAYIYGNPLGVDGQSLSLGVVRDSGYVSPDGELLMKNITVSTAGFPGNSGSPILNKDGNVIGIYAWGIGSTESMGGGLNGGMMQSVCEKLLDLQTDYITKRFIGLSLWTPGYLLLYLSPTLFGETVNANGLVVLDYVTGNPFAGVLSFFSVLFSMTIDGVKYEFKDNESTTPSEITHLLTSAQTVQIEYSDFIGDTEVKTDSINLNADYSGGNIIYDIPIGGSVNKTLNFKGTEITISSNKKYVIPAK